MVTVPIYLIYSVRRCFVTSIDVECIYAAMLRPPGFFQDQTDSIHAEFDRETTETLMIPVDAKEFLPFTSDQSFNPK